MAGMVRHMVHSLILKAHIEIQVKDSLSLYILSENSLRSEPLSWKNNTDPILVVAVIKHRGEMRKTFP